ncbi:MAG TPA: hypothetical protein VLE47_01575 [Candidatus Saccharimonadales bacterium]|nr:hypothetical protein [Candidatus Saccharimonadales bacterium]
MPDQQNQQVAPPIQQQNPNRLTPPVTVQQPTQSYAEQNTSGMGTKSVIPPGVEGWGWGPFYFSLIWGIFNGVWISLLCFVPFVNIAMPFVLGIYGRKWAWQAKHWDSVESFNKTQRGWSIAAAIIVVAQLLIFLLLVIVAVINPSGRT